MCFPPLRQALFIVSLLLFFRQYANWIRATPDITKMHDWHTLSRLFIRSDLSENASADLTQEQMHYITKVMRLTVKDRLRIFNGKDGEWLSEVGQISKKSCNLNVLEQIRPQHAGGDLWLCCAPIKRAHFEYAIEKSTELGVDVILPVLTNRTQIREINQERLGAIAVESAEQSERLTIPEVKTPILLENINKTLPNNARIIVCAEWGDATPIAKALTTAQTTTSQITAIFTGPEGGFTSDELNFLRNLPNTIFVRLGSRILRADTAAIAALSCWQAMRGDWQDTEK